MDIESKYLVWKKGSENVYCEYKIYSCDIARVKGKRSLGQLPIYYEYSFWINNSKVFQSFESTANKCKQLFVKFINDNERSE